MYVLLFAIDLLTYGRIVTIIRSAVLGASCNTSLIAAVERLGMVLAAMAGVYFSVSLHAEGVGVVTTAWFVDHEFDNLYA